MARRCVPDDPVVHVMESIVSADFIGSGKNVRAADALMVATQLRAALHEFRPRTLPW